MSPSPSLEHCWRRAFELLRWVTPDTVMNVEPEPVWDGNTLEGSLKSMDENSAVACEAGIEPGAGSSKLVEPGSSYFVPLFFFAVKVK